MTAPDAAGGANDAAVHTTDNTGRGADTPDMRRLRADADEAANAVDRLRAKADKLRSHAEAAEQAIPDAEAAAEDAKRALADGENAARAGVNGSEQTSDNEGGR